MEAIAEAQEVQQEKEVTNEIVLILGRAIIDLLESTPSVNGKMLYALGKNEAKFEKLAENYRKKQWELLTKYAETNEDGTIKMISEEDAGENPNRFVFKGDSEEQKYQSEMTSYLSTPVDLKLHKVNKNLFESLNINPQRNRSFTVLVDYISM